MNLSLRLHTRTKANRCLTISDLALKIKESDGLPDSEIRRSDTIFRGLGLPDYRKCRTLRHSDCCGDKSPYTNDAIAIILGTYLPYLNNATAIVGLYISLT